MRATSPWSRLSWNTTPATVPASWATPVAHNVQANSGVAGIRCSRAALATMHHRMIDATPLPGWAQALAMPPPLHTGGSSTKPAAERGGATLKSAPRLGWLRISSTGGSRAPMNTAWVSRAVS